MATRRQNVLILYLADSALDAPVIAWSRYDAGTREVMELGERVEVGRHPDRVGQLADLAVVADPREVGHGPAVERDFAALPRVSGTHAAASKASGALPPLA